jgi:hypothetical protein
MNLRYRKMESDADKMLLKAAVIQKHYLHRLPPISFGFGAFAEDAHDTHIKGLWPLASLLRLRCYEGWQGLNNQVTPTSLIVFG